MIIYKLHNASVDSHDYIIITEFIKDYIALIPGLLEVVTSKKPDPLITDYIRFHVIT